MHTIAKLLLLTVLTSPTGLLAATPPDASAPQETVLFTAGQGGYKSYRIPAIIAGAKEGTLLAFCEARVNSASDNGNIDTVMRRSTDGGVTWGEMTLVADAGDDCVGNPCPVLDRTTGRIWLPLMRKAGSNNTTQNKMGTGKGTMEVLMLYSDDDGQTWSKPQNITDQVKEKNWTWYVVGPGCGIQLKDGRLVLPCDHRVAGHEDSFSHVIYSDDHGKTWQIGGSAIAKTNECQVVELAGGDLLLNMRSHHKKNRRAIATSSDRGKTWGETTFHDELLEPTCQASLIALPGGQPGKTHLVFANPASTKRERMTIKLSEDDGRTWPHAKEIYAGPSGYSSLVAMPGNQVGCLYEKDNYKQIVFTRVGLDWVRQGK